MELLDSLFGGERTTDDTTTDDGPAVQSELDARRAAGPAGRRGVTLLSDSDEHAPAVARLADEGYEILTI